MYVVVLTWNGYAHTSRCLQSLQQAAYSNLRVLIVDNASHDGSFERLSAEFPTFTFISNPENLGFARGCNVGIRAAMAAPDCAYVLLLNNDAVVTSHFLEEAIKTAESDRSIGLIGGKILHTTEPNKIWYAGGTVNRWRGGARIRGYGETDHGQYDLPAEVEFVTGALMLIRREVLEKVGLLPEEYFFGVEEHDYSLSVRLAGYKLYYVPEFLVYHLADGSHYNYDPKFVYNGYRNKLIFAEKFLPLGLFPIWRLALSLYAKYAARRAWQRLIRKFEYDKLASERGVTYSHEDMRFALITAIKDHRKNVLSEHVLRDFEEILRERKRVEKALIRTN